MKFIVLSAWSQQITFEPLRHSKNGAHYVAPPRYLSPEIAAIDGGLRAATRSDEAVRAK